MSAEPTEAEPHSPWQRFLAIASLLVGLAVIPVTHATPAVANGGCAPEAAALNGDGAYLIDTPGKLVSISGPSLSANATFLQTVDLDLTSCGNWPGIGGGWDGNNPNNPFTGTYDGGGRAITNLTINWTTGQGAGWGLFRSASGATFRNLTLSSVTISTTSHSEFNVVGSLIGLASNVTISAVTVSAASIAATNNLGGLLGSVIAPATLSGITVHATVTGAWGSSNNAGGLIGAIPAVSASVAITNVNATGTVSGYNGAGGLIGSISASIDLTNSFATGNVTGHASLGGLIGGLVGTQIGASSPFNISHSYATGNVTGTHDVGGLIGAHEAYRPGTLHNLYARGSVTGSERVGGLVGWLRQSSSVTNAYSTGVVTRSGGGAHPIGGLIGLLESNASLSATFWDTSTSGQALGVGSGATVGAAGVTTSALQSLSTFVDAGWSIARGDQNLTTIWGLCDGASYPYLSWQTQRASWTPPATPCESDNDNDSDHDSDSNTNPGSDIPPPPLVNSSTPSTAPSPTPSTTAPVVTSPPASTVPSPRPVTNGGDLPVLVPGASQVLIDGRPETVNVFVDNATDLVLSGDGFQLRLAARCTRECPITTDADGREVLTLERQGSTRLDGTGFKANTPISVWLFSEPTLLGELTVNSSGGFSGLLPLGDIAEGAHTLQVNGTSVDGKPRTANIGVHVIPQQAPTPGDGGTLPATGSDTIPIALTAVVLLGLGLVAVTRRRHITR
jgi:LPXTG-motif cell wall-anchored protein